MAGAKLTPTAAPGVYRREGDRGTRYVFIHLDKSGKQRQETARTFKDARELKSRRQLGDTKTPRDA